MLFSKPFQEIPELEGGKRRDGWGVWDAPEIEMRNPARFNTAADLGEDFAAVYLAP